MAFPTWHRPYLALYEVRSRGSITVLLPRDSSRLRLCAFSKFSRLLRFRSQIHIRPPTKHNGRRLQQTSGCLIGIGPQTRSLLHKSFPSSKSASKWPMAPLRPCKIHCLHTSSTLSLKANSALHTEIGSRPSVAPRVLVLAPRVIPHKWQGIYALTPQFEPTPLTCHLYSNLTGRNGTIAYQLKHSTYILLTQIDNWLNMSNHSSGGWSCTP